MSVYLGIDTSNYTTSVAAFDEENEVMFSEKKLLPVSENSCGLRQSDAVFSHIKQLSDVFKNTYSNVNGSVNAVGFSVSPCDFEGSYMPCFMVGKMLGKVLCSAYGVKGYEFSHQQGHIAAALFSISKLNLLDTPFIALHISGGTTDLLYVEPDQNKIIKISRIGGTLDLKAGQAIDRIGVMLGLKFPCGAEMEQLSLKSTKEFNIKPYIKEMDCSLSGIENKAKLMFENNEKPCDISKFCLDYISKTLIKICDNASKIYPNLPFVFAGGVMSNKKLQKELSDNFGGYFAEPKYSSDNAAGIAVLTKIAYERNL